jgi:arylformamidase
VTLIDISVPVSPETPPWPGDTPFSCGWTWDMAAGASVNVSTFTTSPHVGTHADAPLHVKPATPGADALPLAAFYGTAVVVDVADLRGSVEVGTLMERCGRAGVTGAVQRLLLKTGNTIAQGIFPDAWPFLSTECVARLVDDGLVLLGVDCPSVDDRESKTLDVHHALFDRGAYVLENLDLRTVSAGVYELIAFPTKLVDLDAAPVRAVLRRT